MTILMAVLIVFIVMCFVGIQVLGRIGVHS